MKRIFIYVGVVAALAVALIVMLRDGDETASPQMATSSTTAASSSDFPKDPEASRWDDMPSKDTMSGSSAMMEDKMMDKKSSMMEDKMMDKKSSMMSPIVGDADQMMADTMAETQKDMTDPFAMKSEQESVLAKSMPDAMPPVSSLNSPLPLHRDIALYYNSQGDLMLRFEKTLEFKNYEEPFVSLGQNSFPVEEDGKYWLVNLGKPVDFSLASDVVVRWGESSQNMIVLSSREPMGSLLIDISSGSKSYLLARAPQKGTLFFDSVTYPPRGLMFSGRAQKGMRVSIIVAGRLLTSSTRSDEWGYWSIDLKDILPAGRYVVDVISGLSSLRRIVEIVPRQQMGTWLPISSTTRLAALDNGNRWFIGQKINNDNIIYSVYYKEQAIMMMK